MARERTAVYRLYDGDGVLLYVGIADSPKERWRYHAATKRWWPEVVLRDVEWYPTRNEAERIEAAAIRDEDPKYNAMIPNLDGSVAGARVRVSVPDVARMDERAKKIKEDIDTITAIDDPEERARVVTELLKFLPDANSALAKSRRDAIKTMRADGLSYGQIGQRIGADRARVFRIESGEPTGATARSRAGMVRAAETQAGPAAEATPDHTGTRRDPASLGEATAATVSPTTQPSSSQAQPDTRRSGTSPSG